MKKILLLLVAMLAVGATARAEDYITDVMVIGGTQTEVNTLKSTYTAQGWTVIDQDLNAGCGSSSDYIYLLYKSASETDVEAGTVITNFLISTATGTIPDSFLSNDRTYHLVPFDGSDYFKGNKGDLNSHCGSSSATIHLYFTKEYGPDGEDYSTVKSIAFNDTQAGGVPVADATTGYDLNTGAGGDYIYMHADKAPGWIITKNTAGTQCYVTGYDGPKRNFKDLIIPLTIDSATVLGFSGMTFSDFTNLETMTFDSESVIDWMPSVQGCTKFKRVKTSNDFFWAADFMTPSSIKTIPAYAFAGTALDQIRLTSVTEIRSHAFDGCNSLDFVVMLENALIDSYAFANIQSDCHVEYSGEMTDLDPSVFMYSPNLYFCCSYLNDNSWLCGWCGGDTVTTNNHLYWTLDAGGNLNIDCYNHMWEQYPQSQLITTHTWEKSTLYPKVKNLTLEHVDTLKANEFNEYTSLETLDVKSGLRNIGKYAFNGCSALKTVYLPSSVTKIANGAFRNCGSLHNLYFDGTDEQWNHDMTRAENWNDYVADDFQAHWHCTVTFDANGQGTAPDPQNIQWSNEDKLDEPTPPSAQGYKFMGWYTDAACYNPWFFFDPVPGDMTLYAGWEPVVVSKPGDANEDSKVDVNDVTTVINHILNKNPNPFNYNNANMNGDDKVDVLDVTLIINIILGLQ